MKLRSRSGFTIIELLVVVAVIGILATVILAAIGNYKAKSHDARRVEDILEIQNALNLYHNDHAEYPPSGGATLPDNTWSSSNDGSWVTLATALRPYINPLPKDPLNTASGVWGATGNVYSYYSMGGGCPQQWYMLVYTGEKSTTVTSPGVVACDGTVYNYGPQGFVGSSAKTVTIGANGK